MSSLLIVVVLTVFSNAQINIKTNSEAWYCNRNPLTLHPISPLPPKDEPKINKLEQVQVMTRHGARTHWDNFQRYFPNSKQYYHCNISTIISRIESPTQQYFIPILKTFEQNNQYLYNSNCQHMQSWPTLIDQHKQNAQILIKTYMSSNTSTHLFDISETNRQKLTLNLTKFYTSNWERCMLSTMVIATEILNISISNNTSLHPQLETITNDQLFNPYTPLDNIICNQQTQFQGWMQKYTTDIFDNYITPKQRDLLTKQQDIINTYKSEGGQWYDIPYQPNQHAGFGIVLFYCNGFDIPLENGTFWGMVQAGLEWVSIQPDRFSNAPKEIEYAEKRKCYNHFLSLPMYKRFNDEIYEMINNGINKRKFILHSAHDTTIEYFLSGLNLYDGVFPYFAQFFTLELYSSNKAWIWENDMRDVEYWFRFTNKGGFVPYEYCMDFYEEKDTELCDLNILLENGFKDVNVTQRDWAEQKCATLLDDCVCGYCGNTTVEDMNVSRNGTDGMNEERSADDKRWEMDEANFALGAVSGCIVTIIIMFGVHYIFTNCKQCCIEKQLRRQYDVTVGDASDQENSDVDIEIEEVQQSELMKLPDKDITDSQKLQKT